VPAGFVPVLAEDELAVGEITEVIIDGVVIVLCNIDGVFFAVQGQCPHASGPLGEGQLDGDVLTCPLHGWGFDVRTKQCSVDPSVTLVSHEVMTLGGDVLVRI